MISGFPLQAALGALLLSPEELQKMVVGSDDGFVPDTTKKTWKSQTMSFNSVPCHSNINEPGGYVPIDQNRVGELLSPNLSPTARDNHKRKILKNSHRCCEGHIQRAEDNR